MNGNFIPTKIALFKGKQIRKTLHNNEWWFSVVDVIETLTDSNKPLDYWYAMKTKEKKEKTGNFFIDASQSSAKEKIIGRSKFLSSDI